MKDLIIPLRVMQGGSRHMNVEDIPAAQTIRQVLKKIDAELALVSGEYLANRGVYRLIVAGHGGREAVVEFSREFLDDIRDNRERPSSTYSRELNEKLEEALWTPVRRSGLTGYDESSLKRLVLEFVFEATKRNESVHKYNTIGRGVRGRFEDWTKTTLTAEEKETLIWVWDELMRLRLISPTGTDSAEPDNWVKLTEAGRATLEQRTFAQRPSLASAKMTELRANTASRESDPFEFDVAISFAGRQRPQAEEIAQYLKDAGVKVFYDKYEQSDLWGKDLYAHLTEVYQKKARYCLMLVSSQYAERVWPTLERRAAQARALSEKGEYILPVRFDDTEIPGLLNTIGYISFSEFGVEAVCKLLLEKLVGASNEAPIRHQTKLVLPPDPPEYWTQRNKLPTTEIFQKIVSQPRWCIWIRPTEFKTARFRSLDQCKAFMQSSSVSVGSLIPYPLVSRRGIPETGDEWIAGETDSSRPRERWNLFRSGQFVHYRAFDIERHPEKIHVLEILDTVTQAFEFAARLAQAGALSGDTAITFDLLDVEALGLTWPADQFGYADVVPRECWCQDKHISVSRVIPSEELDSRKRRAAYEAVIEIYSKFRWLNPPHEKLEAEQARRFASIN